MSGNIIHYVDGLKQTGPRKMSQVILVDNGSPKLLYDYLKTLPIFDSKDFPKGWEYSFFSAHSKTLPDRLNFYLFACKILFNRYPSQTKFAVRRVMDRSRSCLQAMAELADTTLVAKNRQGAVTNHIVETTLSSTGVPVYSFSRAYIVLCSNLPSLKYLEHDLKVQIRQFVDTMCPVDARITKRMLESF